MSWRAQIDDRGVITRYKDTDTGEVISAKEYERRQQMQTTGHFVLQNGRSLPQMTAVGPGAVTGAPYDGNGGAYLDSSIPSGFSGVALQSGQVQTVPSQLVTGTQVEGIPTSNNPLIAPGAKILDTGTGQTGFNVAGNLPQVQSKHSPSQPPTAGQLVQGKNLRMEGVPSHQNTQSIGYKAHGFLDATSIAILLPTLVLLALIIAAAHKKRLFPWQTIRTFNPPSGLMSPREYQRSFLCPPNLRRHGRIGKRNPNATWIEQDGIVVPFGFLARTHLPVTIPMGRLPNKNMFIVAPSGSGKTTLMRAIMKALLAKPCVIIALEAKANDPNLDEKREGFKYTVLPEAQQAGFETLYFNPLDLDSIHWNPLDLDPITFASSIVQDVNSLPPEEQHWAERDHGYISGLAMLLKWGAVMVAGEDENGIVADVQTLPCNPRGLMRLVNNRRNIVESLRRLKSNPNVDASELSELTQTLSSIIRTDTDWDKNIQGVRGRLRMFKNPNVLRVTEKSNIDMRGSMHRPSVLIFGAPASLGPDAESLASCFVYQLQQALHTRYGTASVLPLFAFFDEYQTLNMDIAGRLSAIVRGANGGLTVILQNISQIAGRSISSDPTSPGGSELKTIFSNSAIRVCLHNADESTAKFFSDEIGKHAVIVPGISDHYDAKGFGIFPSTWNRIHSQQVVARVDTDSIKRMEKHHALVYLSPAGDAEFGEVKPIMVDLRGIEEIAKLHLLHNVTGRNQTSDALESQSSPLVGVEPASTLPLVNAMPVPAKAASIAGGADNVCPHCGKPKGKGKFCIECGKPLPSSPVQPPISASIVDQMVAPAMQDASGAFTPVLPAGVAEATYGGTSGQAPNAMAEPQESSTANQGLPSFARMAAQGARTDRIAQPGITTQEWPAGQAGTYLAKAALERFAQSDRVASPNQAQSTSSQQVSSSATTPMQAKSAQKDLEDKFPGPAPNVVASPSIPAESNQLLAAKDSAPSLVPYRADLASDKTTSSSLPTPPVRGKDVEPKVEDMRPANQREPKRAPLKSLNADPEKLGIPYPSENKPIRPNSASSSAGGVEF